VSGERILSDDSCSNDGEEGESRNTATKKSEKMERFEGVEDKIECDGDARLTIDAFTLKEHSK
jgi:hypothetical protein